MARALANGGGVESVLYTAWCSLLAFAVAGGAIGWLAEGIVRDSVNGQIEAEIAAKKAAKKSSESIGRDLIVCHGFAEAVPKIR